MSTREFCNVLDVCKFLAKHRMSTFTSYGSREEFVRGDSGEVKAVPAIKPSVLFRGQTAAYNTLRPSIYRSHAPLSTWQRQQTVRIDGDELLMPHPHYSEALERDFYFSCIKAAELITEVEAAFPDFPDHVDGHAICQHYGLPTHCPVRMSGSQGFLPLIPG
jgi:hypothetical protein